MKYVKIWKFSRVSAFNIIDASSFKKKLFQSFSVWHIMMLICKLMMMIPNEPMRCCEKFNWVFVDICGDFRGALHVGKSCDLPYNIASFMNLFMYFDVLDTIYGSYLFAMNQVGLSFGSQLVCYNLSDFLRTHCFNLSPILPHVHTTQQTFMFT